MSSIEWIEPDLETLREQLERLERIRARMSREALSILCPESTHMPDVTTLPTITHLQAADGSDLVVTTKVTDERLHVFIHRRDDKKAPIMSGEFLALGVSSRVNMVENFGRVVVMTGDSPLGLYRKGDRGILLARIDSEPTLYKINLERTQLDTAVTRELFELETVPA